MGANLHYILPTGYSSNLLIHCRPFPGLLVNPGGGGMGMREDEEQLPPHLSDLYHSDTDVTQRHRQRRFCIWAGEKSEWKSLGNRSDVVCLFPY